MTDCSETGIHILFVPYCEPPSYVDMDPASVYMFKSIPFLNHYKFINDRFKINSSLIHTKKWHPKLHIGNLA